MPVLDAEAPPRKQSRRGLWLFLMLPPAAGLLLFAYSLLNPVKVTINGTLYVVGAYVVSDGKGVSVSFVPDGLYVGDFFGIGKVASLKVGGYGYQVGVFSPYRKPATMPGKGSFWPQRR